MSAEDLAWRLEAWCSARPPGGPPAPQRLAALCPPLGALRVVKVAGTDGKGSTCAMLDAILCRSGQGVVMFSSPHLSRVNERIRLNGQDLDDARWCWALERAEAQVREAEAQGLCRLSFFELLLLAALLLAKEEGVQWFIAEAGVGGRTDATAALPAVAAAITTIGADHLEKLGPSLEDVAAHKAGVAVPGAPLVLGPAISEHHARIIQAQASGARLLRASTAPGRLEAWTTWVETPEGALRLPLAGPHQLDNAGVALTVLHTLIERGLAQASWTQGLTDTRWPGRLERLELSPPWVLDAAHNPHAAAALERALRDRVPFSQRLLVLGCSRGHETALPALLRLAPRVALVGGFHRATPPEELAQRLHADTLLHGLYDRPEAAVSTLSQGEGVRILTGSIFLLGAARPMLLERL